MTRQQWLLAGMSGLIISLPVNAGVRTLTSDEMVETYVKDSAVIVVPQSQRKSDADRRRILKSLTISPGEPVITEAEELAYQDSIRHYQSLNQDDALVQAEEEFLRRALLIPQDQLALAQPPANFNPEIPTIVFGQQAVIPDEPFTQMFLNDQLGINFDGQNVNLSFGNLPGVNQITMPQGINDGPVRLTPRPGGGFDLSIQVPDQQ